MPIAQTTKISDRMIGSFPFPFLPLKKAYDTAYTVFPHDIDDFNVEISEIDADKTDSGDVTYLMEELKKHNCIIENEQAAIDFLEENPNVIDYLYEAPVVINKYFKNPQLSLELFSDPEDDKDTQEVFINIKTSLPVESAREFLEKIDDEWLLNLDAEILNIFNLGLKFV